MRKLFSFRAVGNTDRKQTKKETLVCFYNNRVNFPADTGDASTPVLTSYAIYLIKVPRFSRVQMAHMTTLLKTTFTPYLLIIFYLKSF